MARFAQLVSLKPTVTVRFELPGVEPVEFTVVYRLNAFARHNLAAIQEKSDFVEQLVDIVESWDLLGDDGQPVPVTRETLDQLPVQVLQRIFEAIYDHARIDQGESRRPDDGSRQTASSGRQRRGSS